MLLAVLVPARLSLTQLNAFVGGYCLGGTAFLSFTVTVHIVCVSCGLPTDRKLGQNFVEGQAGPDYTYFFPRSVDLLGSWCKTATLYYQQMNDF